MTTDTTTPDAAQAAAEEIVENYPGENSAVVIAQVIRHHFPPPVAPESLEFAGHTPGPWGHDCAGYVSGGDANGWIATVHYGGPSVEKDEWTANQNLIAAAPTLLAERDALRAENARLREALDQIANDCASIDEADPPEANILAGNCGRIARAALSKTT